jgi:hypothetical protein
MGGSGDACRVVQCQTHEIAVEVLDLAKVDSYAHAQAQPVRPFARFELLLHPHRSGQCARRRVERHEERVTLRAVFSSIGRRYGCSDDLPMTQQQTGVPFAGAL